MCPRTTLECALLEIRLCRLHNTFSLDDFVAHAFPDIAMDLDSFTYSMASYPYMVVHSVSFYDMDSLAPPSLLLFTVGLCSPLPL